MMCPLTPKKPARPKKFDSPRQEAYLNLWRTYDRLRLLEDELFASFGLTAQQYNALRVLRGHHPEGIHTLDLGRRLVSRTPDITRLLDKLEEQAWISRERPRENRRVVLIKVTETGLSLLKKMDPEVLRCSEQQLGHFNESQTRDLIALLKLARAPHEDAESFWS